HSPPGRFTFVGLGAPGWQLDHIVCFGVTGEVSWDITGAATVIKLPHGEKIECIYYYRLPPPAPAEGRIAGTKWNDLNGNGLRDPGEPPLAGWVIHLFKSGGGDPRATSDQVITDASGNYSFQGLAPGVYTVCEAPQAGWTQTAPSTGADCSLLSGVSGRGYRLTLSTGQDLPGNDFGNRQTQTAAPDLTISKTHTGIPTSGGRI